MCIPNAGDQSGRIAPLTPLHAEATGYDAPPNPLRYTRLFSPRHGPRKFSLLSIAHQLFFFVLCLEIWNILLISYDLPNIASTPLNAHYHNSDASKGRALASLHSPPIFLLPYEMARRKLSRPKRKKVRPPLRTPPSQPAIEATRRRIPEIVIPESEPPLIRRWRDAPFHIDDSPENRHLRFPSRRERIMFYMSSWYAPPCKDATVPNNRITAHIVDGVVGDNNETWFEIDGVRQPNLGSQANPHVFASEAPGPDRIFAVNRDQVARCSATRDDSLPLSIEASYCPDILNTIVPLWKETSEIPLLVQVGDTRVSKLVSAPGEAVKPDSPRAFPSIPYLSKTRPAFRSFDWNANGPACDGRQANDGHLQRIIWKLNRKRHYSDLDTVADDDIPWEEKNDMAIFRGMATGRVAADPKKIPLLSSEEKCRLQKRCFLVDSYMGSDLVDAKLVTSTRRDYPEKYYSDSLSRAELLQNKALIMLQGNDVSSGLKWAMLSNSVVMMPIATVSSWFMEEMLQPFVHFVPIKDDLSNVEQQMEWILENDKRARQIAKRSAMWVKDMIFHPDAQDEEDLINAEILARYRGLFEPMSQTNSASRIRHEDVVAQ